MTLEFLYNPTLLQNFTYLEPDSIISSLFVQSVIFGHSLCGLLNKLEGMGKCVGVVVRSYGCGEVRVRRWVWGGVCGEVGVVRWVSERGGGCGCGHGESNSCTELYILRARLYHFIFVCPISYFRS